jgi:hypothetical protein
VCSVFKILSTYICWKNIYKMKHLEGSGTPVPYIGRTVLNLLNAKLNHNCHLLALLWTHHILHVSSIRIKFNSVFKRLTLLTSRPQIPTCTVPTCRFTAVSYLPPPLNFLLQTYTQVFSSAGTVSDPVWRVLLAVSTSQFGLSVLNKSEIIHRIDFGKFLPFPACSGIC